LFFLKKKVGSVILSFDQLENDVDGKIDSITFSSTSSNGSIILEHAFPIAFYRLDEIMNIQYDFLIYYFFSIYHSFFQ